MQTWITNQYHPHRQISKEFNDIHQTSIKLESKMINLTILPAACYEIEHYLKDQLEDPLTPKLFSTAIIPTEGKSDELELNVVTISGELGEDEDNNTGPGWYWGFNLGMCDGTYQGETDAVDVLNTRLNRTIAIPCPIGARVYITEQEVKHGHPFFLPSPTPNPFGYDDNLLFSYNSSDETCLSPEAIVFYYNNIKNDIREIYQPSGKAMLNYLVESGIVLWEADMMYKIHTLTMTFGKVNYTYEYTTSF